MTKTDTHRSHKKVHQFMCFLDNNSHNIQLYQCLVSFSYQTRVMFLVDKMLNKTFDTKSHAHKKEATDKTNSLHVY